MLKTVLVTIPVHSKLDGASPNEQATNVENSHTSGGQIVKTDFSKTLETSDEQPTL